MNWTGGHLSRHANAGGIAGERQKQHFARAQKLLRAPPKKKSPIRWSPLDIAEEQGHREPSLVRQASLNYSDERNQSTRQQHGGSYSNTRHPLNVDHVYPLRPPDQQEEQRFIPIKRCPTSVADDDLYNATPAPRKLKRERQSPVPVPPQEDVFDAGGKSISERRRKLLRKGDWVGVGIQKPLQIKFASPEDEENIGRRRKLKPGYRPQYRTRQGHITSPFPARTRPLAVKYYGGSNVQPDAGRSEVKISIGGRVVPPGVSSSSAPQRAGHSVGTSRLSIAASSDIMLLDNEDPRQRQYEKILTKHSHQDKNTRVTIPPGTPSQSLVSNASVEEDYEDGQRIGHVDSDEYSGWAGISTNADDEIPEGHMQQKSSKSKASHSGSGTSRPDAGSQHLVYSSSDGHPKFPVFSSSSVEIQHPRPCSSKVSVLIRSDSIDEADSTIAHIGETRPVVPSSQAQDNELWESWVAPLQAGGILQERSHSNYSVLNDENIIQISPGISITPARPKQDGGRLFSHANESPEPETSYFTGGDEGSRSHDSLSEESLIIDKEVTDVVGKVQPETPEQAIKRKEAFAVSELFKSVGKVPLPREQTESAAVDELFRAVGKVAVPVDHGKDDDPNDVWRKFVFGSSEGEDAERMISAQKARNISPNSMNCLVGGSTASRGVSELIPNHLDTAGNSAWDSTSIHTSTKGDQGSSVMDQNKSDSIRGLLPSSLSAGFQPKTPFPGSNLSSRGYTSSGESARKVLFTKPRPFVGQNSRGTPIPEQPLHIGRGILREDRDIDSKARKKKDPDDCSFVSSEERDDLESIEDY